MDEIWSLVTLLAQAFSKELCSSYVSNHEWFILTGTSTSFWAAGPRGNCTYTIDSTPSAYQYFILLAIKRCRDQSNSLKNKTKQNVKTLTCMLEYGFRVLVCNHHGGNHGKRHMGTELEQWLITCTESTSLWVVLGCSGWAWFGL